MLDHTIPEFGTYQDARRRDGPLTDRQREVFDVPYALGYYEQPRRTSHDAIDCSASTVDESSGKPNTGW